VPIEDIAAADHVDNSARQLVETVSGRGRRAWADITCLNAAPILYISGKAENLETGFEQAREVLGSGRAIDKLEQWVVSQNRSPELGQRRFEELLSSTC